jgi:hypothetical protein
VGGPRRVSPTSLTSKIKNPNSSFINPFFSSQMKHPPFRQQRETPEVMDRNLIAPCPDHHWHVANIHDPRRSNGEKKLIERSGKSLLLPKDPAFHPDADGLEWR